MAISTFVNDDIDLFFLSRWDDYPNVAPGCNGLVVEVLVFV
ncbi:unnamed protein product [Acidithrix sp. C25]|nr:unnamed protein product [Acidithrix sp. C25]